MGRTLTRTGVLAAALPLVLVAVTCASAATVVAPVHTQTYADAARRRRRRRQSVIQSKSFRESFDAGVVTFSVKRTELGIGKAFRFQAFSMVVDANGDAAFDYVPAQHETASYTMGTAPPKPKKKR